MTKNILKQECEAYCAPECEVIAITPENAIASNPAASINDWADDGEDDIVMFN